VLALLPPIAWVVAVAAGIGLLCFGIAVLGFLAARWTSLGSL
jgi:hypothetical protein